MRISETSLILLINCIGHFLVHVITALYFTLVLVIGPSWGQSYDHMIRLWTIGAFLVGAGAPLAGWLGDRIGEPQVMALFFLGLGSGAILCGAASSPDTLMFALAVTGLFASIYHPVSLSWLTKHSLRQGRAIGFVGIFGTLGVASAAVLAGWISDVAGWRSAFIVPGVAAVSAGIALGTSILQGCFKAERSGTYKHAETKQRPASSRALMALAASMVFGSVFYNSFVTFLPRWLNQVGAGVGHVAVSEVGTIVALIFLFGGLAQIPGGVLADRLPARALYLGTSLVQLGSTAAAIWVTGGSAIVLGAVLALVLDFRAPVESVLLARYSPGSRRGLAYGAKYAMGFVGAPLGVNLVAFMDGSRGASSLFAALGVLVAGMIVAAACLPTELRMDASRESSSNAPPSRNGWQSGVFVETDDMPTPRRNYRGG